MKTICYELMDAASGRASPEVVRLLASSAPELVTELVWKVEQVRGSFGLLFLHLI